MLKRKNVPVSFIQDFYPKTKVFRDATISEKLVICSNASLLKNPENNLTEPMPTHGLRPFRKVGDIYGNYIVTTDTKLVPCSNSGLLQAKRMNPITGSFWLRKEEPVPVPSNMSKEYRKLLNLNALPEGYALNKGPKKIELAFLSKLRNDQAKMIVLEFMKNSVGGQLYKPLLLNFTHPDNKASMNAAALAKSHYNDAINELTKYFERGITSGPVVDAIIDNFTATLRKLYGNIARWDDKVDPTDMAKSIKQLQEYSFELAGHAQKDREDPAGIATPEQTNAILTQILQTLQGSQEEKKQVEVNADGTTQSKGGQGNVAVKTTGETIPPSAPPDLPATEEGGIIDEYGDDPESIFARAPGNPEGKYDIGPSEEYTSSDTPEKSPQELAQISERLVTLSNDPIETRNELKAIMADDINNGTDNLGSIKEIVDSRIIQTNRTIEDYKQIGQPVPPEVTALFNADGTILMKIDEVNGQRELVTKAIKDYRRLTQSERKPKSEEASKIEAFSEGDKVPITYPKLKREVSSFPIRTAKKSESEKELKSEIEIPPTQTEPQEFIIPNDKLTTSSVIAPTLAEIPNIPDDKLIPDEYGINLKELTRNPTGNYANDLLNIVLPLYRAGIIDKSTKYKNMWANKNKAIIEYLSSIRSITGTMSLSDVDRAINNIRGEVANNKEPVLEKYPDPYNNKFVMPFIPSPSSEPTKTFVKLDKPTQELSESPSAQQQSSKKRTKSEEDIMNQLLPTEFGSYKNTYDVADVLLEYQKNPANYTKLLQATIKMPYESLIDVRDLLINKTYLNMVRKAGIAPEIVEAVRKKVDEQINIRAPDTPQSPKPTQQPSSSKSKKGKSPKASKASTVVSATKKSKESPLDPYTLGIPVVKLTPFGSAGDNIAQGLMIMESSTTGQNREDLKRHLKGRSDRDLTELLALFNNPVYEKYLEHNKWDQGYISNAKDFISNELQSRIKPKSKTPTTSPAAASSSSSAKAVAKTKTPTASSSSADYDISEDLNKALASSESNEELDDMWNAVSGYIDSFKIPASEKTKINNIVLEGTKEAEKARKKIKTMSVKDVNYWKQQFNNKGPNDTLIEMQRYLSEYNEKAGPTYKLTGVQGQVDINKMGRNAVKVATAVKSVRAGKVPEGQYGFGRKRPKKVTQTEKEYKKSTKKLMAMEALPSNYELKRGPTKLSSADLNAIIAKILSS